MSNLIIPGKREPDKEELVKEYNKLSTEDALVHLARFEKLRDQAVKRVGALRQVINYRKQNEYKKPPPMMVYPTHA